MGRCRLKTIFQSAASTFHAVGAHPGEMASIWLVPCMGMCFDIFSLLLKI